ncbi:malonic semialdehyde reductase [Demequina capsici]|uniref:Malonic semialdehyde reductase n=1 Tax=Demequina capsici TaxID=3075620 RepID=A0AA96F8M1_9MICO|nr:malonic semialdehyde reductase [Demequina sp. OYTSA14]WNM24011.1 malonic semialdehyde reductase [Demequina sp. OYTSA14]
MSAVPDLSAASFQIPQDAIRLLFLDARSATRWADREVSLDTLKAVHELVRWAPSANNSAPLRLVVAGSDHAREIVMEHASPGNRPKLDRAPMILVAASDARYHEHLDVTAPGIRGLYEVLEDRPDARAITAHDSTWLQIGFLIVALRSAGLHVRPMGGFDRAGLSRSLLGDRSWHPELLLAVGYPAQDGEHGAGDRRGRPSWDTATLEL